MKMLKLAGLGLAVLLYATAAMAQHGHGGGAGGMGMGNGMGMGHGASTPSHGNTSSGTSDSGTSHKATVNEILSKNPAIGDKIATLTGDKAGAADACTGFKNLGQCVAAAHVAKNLPNGNFYCLRQAMTGTLAPSGVTCNTTGSMSLGKAIQTLYPHADSKTESKKAGTEAQQDMKISGEKS